MIYEFEGMTPRVHPTAWIAPTATVIGNVEIGAEASIWFGAVIRGDQSEHEIRIGARSNVQDNSVVHVSVRGPTVIDEDVTIGHAAVLESCTIGKGALIGMNAVVLQNAIIGERALVAAGSVVSTGAHVPPEHLTAGNPATVRKAIGGAFLQRMAGIPERYVRLSRRYLAAGGGSTTPMGGGR